MVVDDGTARERTFAWAATHASYHNGLATGRDRRIVLMLPGTDPGAAARAVVKELTRGQRIFAAPRST